MPYTDEQRTNAVALADEHGPAEASRQTGIPRRTISSWRLPARAEDKKRTEKASAARDERHRKQRAQLGDVLLEKAVLFAEALTPGKDSRNTATALGIIIDKYRLEQGEVTDRTESRTQSDLDREIQTRVDEWRRQLEPS